MAHHCHVPRCAVVVPPKFLMCRRHWNLVPDAAKKAVWMYYRPGQEVDKNPSDAYLRAAAEAITAVEDIEPHLCRQCQIDTRTAGHHPDCPTRQRLLAL